MGERILRWPRKIGQVFKYGLWTELGDLGATTTALGHIMFLDLRALTLTTIVSSPYRIDNANGGLNISPAQ